MSGYTLCLKTGLSAFVFDRSGAVGIFFGLMLVPLFGFIGISVDYGRALKARQILQSAADTAALSAATMKDSTDKEKIERAETVFNANYANRYSSNIPISVAVSGGTISVSATLELPTPFLNIMGNKTLTLVTRSEAVADYEGKACMLALNASAADAIAIQGSTTLAAKGCWAWANSKNAAAITGTGGATAVAAGFCTKGGAVQSGNYDPKPQTGCSTLPDPYASLKTPHIGACSFRNRQLGNGDHVLNPGVYCGGLELKPHAAASFMPGVYIIKDGPLRLQAGSVGTGAGVVFFFTGSNSTLQINGGASVNFTAPSDGELGGFLFVQDRTSSVGLTTVIQGGGNVRVNGVLYMPTQVVDIGGNGDLNLKSEMFAMVADRFTLRGTGALSLKVDYQSAGLPDVAPHTPLGARLVN
jgi:hypothetical protein